MKINGKRRRKVRESARERGIREKWREKKKRKQKRRGRCRQGGVGRDTESQEEDETKQVLSSAGAWLECSQGPGPGGIGINQAVASKGGRYADEA